jgi:hypothetical protein
MAESILVEVKIWNLRKHQTTHCRHFKLKVLGRHKFMEKESHIKDSLNPGVVVFSDEAQLL